MADDFEKSFPLGGLVLCIGLPCFYLIELNEWWRSGAQLDPFAGCVDYGVVTKCWWRQDMISNFLGDFYVRSIIPSWNPLASDPTARLMLAAVVLLAYGALVTQVVKHLYAWFHSK